LSPSSSSTQASSSQPLSFTSLLTEEVRGRGFPPPPVYFSLFRLLFELDYLSSLLKTTLPIKVSFTQ